MSCVSHVLPYEAARTCAEARSTDAAIVASESSAVSGPHVSRRTRRRCSPGRGDGAPRRGEAAAARGGRGGRASAPPRPIHRRAPSGHLDPLDGGCLSSALGQQRKRGSMTEVPRSLLRRRGPPSTGGRLTLLDAFALAADGRVIELPTPSRRLLAYLALQERPLHRAYLAGALWLDSSEARAAGSLRSALWKIRRCGCELVEEDDHRLRLADSVRVDVREAHEWAARVQDPAREIAADDVGAASDAAELLRDWYDDWVVLERERFRQLRAHALEVALVAARARGTVRRGDRGRARRGPQRAPPRERTPSGDRRAPRGGESCRGATSLRLLPSTRHRQARHRAVGADGDARPGTLGASVSRPPPGAAGRPRAARDASLPRRRSSRGRGGFPSPSTRARTTTSRSPTSGGS